MKSCFPAFSDPRPSRIYPNWHFWFENKPSGNPGIQGCFRNLTRAPIFRYAHAIQTMVHITQQRQIIPWLMNDALFRLSGFQKEHDESLEILHKFTKSVIAGLERQRPILDFAPWGKL
jgi:hypothetical protein